MSDLTIIVTNAGRAALVNATNTGTDPVTITQCGVSATAVVPTPALTALPGEIKRISTLSGDVVDDDTIHLIVRDETADAYTLRSIALYLADGTLFAIYGQAGAIMEKSAQAMLLLAVDVRFADIDATDLTFGDANFLNPAATTATPGVVELSTDAEADTGTDTQRAVTPKAMKTAVTNWLNARFGEGAPSAFIKGLLLSASAAAFRVSLGLKSAALKDEGAGNALDADLLDGQHGAYYANIPARLGYTPWGPSNDGAGSGLDADLLDGQDSGYYTNIPGRLGFTPWGPSNDGAGSGLDADLFDGIDSGRFVYGDNANKTSNFTGGNINSARPSGFYDGSAVTNAPGADWWHFINVRHNNESNHYAAQVAFDFYANDFRIRTIANNVPKAWARIWHDQNDGAGSGLDADLLDGQDGSYYTNIVARLGYTPLNAASYTAGDVLGKILTVDGAGSGLDADLLDGQDGGYYTNIVARLGYTPLNSASYTAGDVLGKIVTVDGAGSGLDADLLDGQQGSYYTDIVARLGYTPLNFASYTAADVLGKMVTVDGAGSGLDADLLDGYQGSAYRRVVASSLVENGGYIKYSDGFIECWGYADIGANVTSMTVNLPTAHTSWVNPHASGGLATNTADENYASITGIVGAPPTGFTVSNSYQTGHRFYWSTRGV